MSEKFTIEKIKAAARHGECDMSATQAKCPRCLFRKNAPEMVDFLLAELDARSFPSEADKKLLRLAVERLDDGSAWADESEEFRDLKSLVERLGTQ